jgi:hypothetical protein
MAATIIAKPISMVIIPVMILFLPVHEPSLYPKANNIPKPIILETRIAEFKSLINKKNGEITIEGRKTKKMHIRAAMK